MAKIDDDQRSKLIFLVCRLLATTTCKNGRHKKHLVGERQLASNIFWNPLVANWRLKPKL